MDNEIQSVRTRTLIKQGLGKLLTDRYSAKDGTVGQWFREVKVGTWTPGNKMRPAATVVDFGAKKSGKANSGTTKNRVLAGQIILDLADQFDRENVLADWSDRVEQIALAIQNYKAAAGLLRMDYMADEPFEVVLTEGKSEQIWVIEFEAEYFVECPAFD